MPASPQALALDVRDLAIGFPAREGWVRVVDGVTFALSRGETLGIVGESGSGKSMTALALLGLVPAPGRVLEGSIRLGGAEITALGEPGLRRIRGREVAMVFQDPMTGLNPVRTVGSQLAESLKRHAPGLSRTERAARLEAALAEVGIPAPRDRLRAYPHQLSGGLRQRVMIALALLNRPALIVSDEATTALDATIQAQVLDLFRRCLDEAALILITHDLGVAASVCDRICVMYAGRFVEHGTAADVLTSPRHPYTQSLLAAAPRFDPARPRLLAIPGTPPRPSALPPGCSFQPRCGRAQTVCGTRPPLRTVGGRLVACHLAQPA